jgi:transposase
MHAYSSDLRERVVRAVDRGESTHKQIAERFGVGTAWIKKLLKRRRETGSIAARAHGGGRKAKYEGSTLERLRQELQQQPDATLEELRNRTQRDASLMAVFRALKRLGSHRKKSRSVPPSKIGPTSPRSGGAGLKSSGISRRIASSSTTKAEPKPT